MSAPAGHVTGYVLAGGESRRMGGRHKALVEHSGQPLYQFAVKNLKSCCTDVLINTHRGHDEFIKAGFNVVEDTEFSGCGPVAGLYTALSHSVTPFVAIAACDQLALPEHVYPRLVLEVTDKVGVYAIGSSDIVPTCAVLPVALSVKARSALASGDRSLMAFMHAHARPIKFNDVEFGNVNSTSQLNQTRPG